MYFMYTTQVHSSAVPIQFVSRNTESEHLENRDLSVVESFYVYPFRYEGLGIIGFYTTSKPKINLQHTFYVNF